MTKKTKKLLAAAAIALLLILAVVICFALPGQGGPAESTGPSTTGSAAATRPTTTAPTTTASTPTGSAGATEPTAPEHTHSYTAEVVEPSCTAGGYTIYTCSCGDSYRDNEVPATGHTWGDWVTTKEPTETEEGEAQQNCTSCTVTETKVLEKLAHVHTYTDTIVEPTCTEDGYTLHTCACGDSYMDNVVPTDGTHRCTGTEFEATCTEDGYWLYECPCGFSYTKVVEAAGHRYGLWVTIQEPTVTEPGQKERTCEACGDVNTQVIPATGENRESFIDPSLTVKKYGARTTYSNADVLISDRRTWADYIEIRKTKDGNYCIIYCMQDGTLVEYILEPPPEGLAVTFRINEDGSYTVRYNGAFG